MPEQLDEYFLPLSQRENKRVLFYRFTEKNDEVDRFLRQYYLAAIAHGAVIEGKIPNPTLANLDYYGEMLGMQFAMDEHFIHAALQKWLPRLDGDQRTKLAHALLLSLQGLAAGGKNENILKNAYIKLMCWLYYKFEAILHKLGGEQPAKILCEGSPNVYELCLQHMLAILGADIVLLMPLGDAEYRKLDPDNSHSQLYMADGLQPFSPTFSVAQMRREIAEENDVKRLYTTPPSLLNRTNSWMRERSLQDVLTPPTQRGQETGFFYNAFLRIQGVEDKITYPNELYQFYLTIKNQKRNIAVAEGSLLPPYPEEIEKIRRGRYETPEQLMVNLAENLGYITNTELHRTVHRAFIDVMRAEAAHNTNINQLTNLAVYMLCWFRRYHEALFSGASAGAVGVFVHLGACKRSAEAAFLCLLAKLPLDVVVLMPNLNETCCLESADLLTVKHAETMVMEHFPVESRPIHLGTAAYHAERELDGILYENTGLYRNHQYQTANAITLQTMLEEIWILWDAPLKYRPNFSVVDDVVNIPVISAKILGVQDGNVGRYWSDIKKLITPDTYIIRHMRNVTARTPNALAAHATQFLKNGKLQRNTIVQHKEYRYAVLRREMQEHLLDKLQQLLDQKLISGTYENGAEYSIVATALNLGSQLIRLIQKFDFTKTNPKLIYINTTDQTISLEDSITAAFLHLVGFDLLFCVPTGYMSTDRYFGAKLVEEYQVGDYLYDLTVPDFNNLPVERPNWRDKLFGRGG